MEIEFTFLSILQLILLNIFLLALSIVIHELGHFIFCLLFKVKIKKVILGSGKLLFTLGIFEVHLYPTGGSNIPETYDVNLSKWKIVLVFLGGVLANLIAIIVYPYSFFWVVWNGSLIIANLLPIRTKKTISDGLFILAIMYDMVFLNHESSKMYFKEKKEKDK